MFFNRRVLPVLPAIILLAVFNGCAKKGAGDETTNIAARVTTNAEAHQNSAPASPDAQFQGIVDALSANDLPALKNLLNLNPSLVYKKDGAGETALIKATALNKVDLAAFLIDRGAQVNARTKRGGTALDRARALHLAEMSKLLQSHGGKSGRRV